MKESSKLGNMRYRFSTAKCAVLFLIAAAITTFAEGTLLLPAIAAEKPSGGEAELTRLNAQLADAYRTKDFDKAAITFAQILKTLEKVAGPDDPSLVTSNLNYAQLLYKLKEDSKARAAESKALQIQLKIAPPTYRYGFIDLKTKFAINPAFHWAPGRFNSTQAPWWNFSEERAAVAYKLADKNALDGETRALLSNSLLGFITKEGKPIVSDKYAQAVPFSNGLAAGNLLNGGYEIIDPTGKAIVHGKETIKGPFHDGLFRFAKGKTGTKYGFLDKSGTTVVEPTFADARDFSEERAAVKQDDKWGYIDNQGRTAIEPKFNAAGDFSEGVACVTVAGANAPSYIDQTGAEQLKLPSIDGSIYKGAYKFSDGLARVELIGTTFGFGYIDHLGNMLIAPKFTDAHDFSNGLAAVCVGSTATRPDGIRGLWGFIDKHGNFVIRPKYYWVGDFHDGLAPAMSAP